MSKNVKLLLTENVDSLGIVGDVVNVRTGYARNFLLPRNLATKPSEAMVKAVASKRAEAQKQLSELRKHREELIKKLQGIEITMVRSCNDLGHLYASVTQPEIAQALVDAGYKAVRPRDVRLNQNIKRVDHYDVHIKFDSDLDAVIKLHVQADRKLDLERAREEERAAEAAADAAAHAEAKAAKEGAEAKAPKDAADAKPAKEAKAPKEGGEPKAEKKPKKEKGEGGEKKGDGKAADAAAGPKKETWGKVVDQGPVMPEARPRRERR